MAGSASSTLTARTRKRRVPQTPIAAPQTATPPIDRAAIEVPSLIAQHPQASAIFVSSVLDHGGARDRVGASVEAQEQFIDACERRAVRPLQPVSEVEVQPDGLNELLHEERWIPA